MNDYICKICKQHCKSLSKHILIHNINEQDYYDTYMKKKKDGLCPVCNNITKFSSIYNGYNKYCSRACLNKSSTHTKSVKNTKLIRYGNPYYTNPSKISQSLLSRTLEQKEESNKKDKLTRLMRYGNENYNNSTKYKETCMRKYGATSPFQNKKIIKKINDKWNSKSKEEQQLIITKRKNTINAKSIEEKKLIGQKHRDAWFSKSKEEQELIKTKSNNTKKKNHSFKQSNLENTCYLILKKIFKNVERSYKSNVYPFNCDFYIPNLDLYIECNFHWTHGGCLYNSRTKHCKEQLNLWKEKSFTSKYFNNAIYTWTIRDVNKYKIALQNKLNYKVFYTKDEFDNYINSIMQ